MGRIIEWIKYYDRKPHSRSRWGSLFGAGVAVVTISSVGVGTALVVDIAHEHAKLSSKSTGSSYPETGTGLGKAFPYGQSRAKSVNSIFGDTTLEFPGTK